MFNAMPYIIHQIKTTRSAPVGIGMPLFGLSKYRYAERDDP